MKQSIDFSISNNPFSILVGKISFLSEMGSFLRLGLWKKASRLRIWVAFEIGLVASLDFYRLTMVNLRFSSRICFGLWFAFAVFHPVLGLRPLRERSQSWGDEVSIEFLNALFIQLWLQILVLDYLVMVFWPIKRLFGFTLQIDLLPFCSIYGGNVECLVKGKAINCVTCWGN